MGVMGGGGWVGIGRCVSRREGGDKGVTKGKKVVAGSGEDGESRGVEDGESRKNSADENISFVLSPFVRIGTSGATGTNGGPPLVLIRTKHRLSFAPSSRLAKLSWRGAFLRFKPTFEAPLTCIKGL